MKARRIRTWGRRRRVSAPDDELGAALGVPQEPDAEVITAGEILGERDRHRWRIERETALEEREVEEP